MKGAPQIRNPDLNSPEGTTLRVSVQKLDNGDVLVPGSLLPIFDLKVNGHTNSYIVNNVSRALVDRLTVKFAGKIMQEKSCRKLMVMIYLSSMRTFQPQLVELLVVVVLTWINRTWNGIPQDLIEKSFKSCGIVNALELARIKPASCVFLHPSFIRIVHFTITLSLEENRRLINSKL